MLRLCGLCKTNSKLLDSHLIPAAFYKAMREPSLKNPNPVIVRRGNAATSSAQVRQWFLCILCERRFHCLGEDWVLRNYARPDGSFPLHEEVNSLRPVASFQGQSLYSAKDVSGIDCEKIEYFASSVFWRAAATRWRNHPFRLEMGPYQEKLRKYLVGEECFPANIVMRVVLTTPQSARSIVLLPLTDRRNGMHGFTFLVPGILFSVILGKHISEQDKLLAFSHPLERIICISDAYHQPYIARIAKTMKDSAPKGDLKNLWKGPDPRKR